MFVALAAAATDPGPWEFGWEALVAIGTLLLAFATGGLALSTRILASKTAEEVKHSGRLVEESQRQAEAATNQASATQDALAQAREQTKLSEQTLNAQIRPVLIDVPLELAFEEPLFFPGRDDSVISHRGAVGVSVGANDVLVSVPVRNAGVGLAMIRGVSLEIGTPIPPPAVSMLPTNIALGERGRLNFRMEQGHGAYVPVAQLLARKQSVSVVVAYSDLAAKPGAREVGGGDLGGTDALGFGARDAPVGEVARGLLGQSSDRRERCAVGLGGFVG